MIGYGFEVLSRHSCRCEVYEVSWEVTRAVPEGGGERLSENQETVTGWIPALLSCWKWWGLETDGEGRGHPSLLGGLSALGSLMDDSVAHQDLQNADLLWRICVGKSSFRRNDFLRCLWEDGLWFSVRTAGLASSIPYSAVKSQGWLNYSPKERQADFLINPLGFYRL